MRREPWLLQPVLALLLIRAAPVAAATELPDGTLLFVENCSSVVERSTHGEIAHVAFVFADSQASWVYEATPAKVRRVELNEYLLEIAKLNQRRKASEQVRVLSLRPLPEYEASESTAMREFAESQLGRRYSIKNYVRGKPYDGIHCAELTARMLNESGRYAIADCHKLSPQALYHYVAATHAAPDVLDIPTLDEPEAWLARLQRGSLAWLTWCRWFSREAWLFLW